MEQEQEIQNTREHVKESTQAGTPLLRVEQVNKMYRIPDGKLEVLHEVDLQVQWGEFVRHHRTLGFRQDHLALAYRRTG